MPYISKADQERSQWMTLLELTVELRESDKCDDKSAQDQIRAMLVDGVLDPLRWDPPALVRVAVPKDLAPWGAVDLLKRHPPRNDPHWQEVKINWEAGKVYDDFEILPICKPKWRSLLIKRDIAHIKLREARNSWARPQFPRSTTSTENGATRLDDRESKLEQLADWIFDQNCGQPKPRSCAALYEIARQDPPYGTFTKAEFLAAYRAVYQSKAKRPPATGWPYTAKYEQLAEEIKSRKSPGKFQKS